jgi:hypothetical protein
VSAAERLAALLEQTGPSDPSNRQLLNALRRTPKELPGEFDYYLSLVEAVGAAQAARAVVHDARTTHRRWLAG